jgi:hypothetical protein
VVYFILLNAISQVTGVQRLVVLRDDGGDGDGDKANGRIG